MSLPNLEVPNTLNYIGAFLTMGCNLSCSYCINDPDQADHRNELFPIQSIRRHVGLSPEEWAIGLSRLPKREDLPITLCGGEPSIYWNNKGVNHIVRHSDHYFDMLTNLVSTKPFDKFSDEDVAKFQRKSPYPSIRVSWHEDEMNRVWKGKGFENLVENCEKLKWYGFKVTGEQIDSDIGIYMVAHPSNELPDKELYEGKVPFATKEFLGIHKGEVYGTYAYPHAIDLVKLGHWPHPLSCKCLTNELLIDPAGFIHTCHLYLYENWSINGLTKEFYQLQQLDYEFTDNIDIFDNVKLKPIGHILDPKLSLDILAIPRVCYQYGECIGCDVKLKTSHFKEGEEISKTYSSVKITEIAWPEKFK